MRTMWSMTTRFRWGSLLTTSRSELGVQVQALSVSSFGASGPFFWEALEKVGIWSACARRRLRYKHAGWAAPS